MELLDELQEANATPGDALYAIQEAYEEGRINSIEQALAELPEGMAPRCSCGARIRQDSCGKCGTWHDLYGRR